MMTRSEACEKVMKAWMVENANDNAFVKRELVPFAVKELDKARTANDWEATAEWAMLLHLMTSEMFEEGSAAEVESLVIQSNC